MATSVTIPMVIEAFSEYQLEHPSWGSLHVVLEEGNVSNQCVQGALEYAQRTGDATGMILASMLLLMSKSQRGRIARKVQEYQSR